MTRASLFFGTNIVFHGVIVVPAPMSAAELGVSPLYAIQLGGFFLSVKPLIKPAYIHLFCVEQYNIRKFYFDILLNEIIYTFTNHKYAQVKFRTCVNL